jgi:hypothetical protein
MRSKCARALLKAERSIELRAAAETPVTPRILTGDAAGAIEVAVIEFAERGEASYPRMAADAPPRLSRDQCSGEL